MHLPHALYSPSPPSGKWYWIKCRQCDVSNAHYIHYSKKFSNDLVNSWILTYCNETMVEVLCSGDSSQEECSNACEVVEW